MKYFLRNVILKMISVCFIAIMAISDGLMAHPRIYSVGSSFVFGGVYGWEPKLIFYGSINVEGIDPPKENMYYIIEGVLEIKENNRSKYPMTYDWYNLKEKCFFKNGYGCLSKLDKNGSGITKIGYVRKLIDKENEYPDLGFKFELSCKKYRGKEARFHSILTTVKVGQYWTAETFEHDIKYIKVGKCPKLYIGICNMISPIKTKKKKVVIERTAGEKYVVESIEVDNNSKYRPLILRSADWGGACDLHKGMAIHRSDKIIVDKGTKIILKGKNETIKIGSEDSVTIFTIYYSIKLKKTKSDLFVGEVEVKVDPNLIDVDFSVSTPTSTSSVRGTIFSVKHSLDGNYTEVCVRRGKVKINYGEQRKENSFIVKGKCAIIGKDYFNKVSIDYIDRLEGNKMRSKNDSINNKKNISMAGCINRHVLIKKLHLNMKDNPSCNEILSLIKKVSPEILKQIDPLKSSKTILKWNTRRHTRTSLKKTYIGCFRDKGDPSGTRGRDLDGLAVSHSTMSVGQCIDLCSKKGFPYAGVQYGSWCFCGDSYGKFGKADNCNMACSGNASEICGGSWANSVYRVVLDKKKYALPPHKKKPSQPPMTRKNLSHVESHGKGRDYVGCFRDKGDSAGTRGRDLDRFALFGVMDIDKCIHLCGAKGFAYAGVQYGSQCFCDNDYGKYGKADNCNMPCNGNPKEICGGKWANSVYRVRPQKPGTPPKAKHATAHGSSHSSFEPGIDRMGGDYRDFDLSKPDPHLCEQACLDDKRCKAWTYVKPNTIQGPRPRCWLKDSVPKPLKRSCCVSGVKNEKRDTIMHSLHTQRLLRTFTHPKIDGLRLDWCLRWNEGCGKQAADAFCRRRGYERASSWAKDRHIGLREPTKVISTGQICRQSFCDGFKYIRCIKGDGSKHTGNDSGISDNSFGYATPMLCIEKVPGSKTTIRCHTLKSEELRHLSVDRYKKVDGVNKKIRQYGFGDLKMRGRSLVLEPGFYRLNYMDVHSHGPGITTGLYGESKIFEIKAGRKQTISILARPAL